MTIINVKHVCKTQEDFDNEFSNDLGFDLTCYPLDLGIELGTYHLKPMWWATLYEYSVPIKFCPFCGKELK